MSLKHLADGSEFPPLSGKLRLYSMKYCPYAQRSRLVLVHKKIAFEEVNINLSKKPKWYLELNPAGAVPCLHIEQGKVIPESLIVSEYLDNAYPTNKLIPTDPLTKAQHQLIIEAYSSKIITNFYKIVKNEADGHKNLIDGLDQVIEKKLTNDYFGGNQPAFVDLMIWPWLERLEYLQKYKNVNIEPSKFPKLLAYVKRMQELPAVKELINKPEAYNKFTNGFLTGNPEFDFEI